MHACGPIKSHVRRDGIVPDSAPCPRLGRANQAAAGMHGRTQHVACTIALSMYLRDWLPAHVRAPRGGVNR
jgi:hypothetical protein